MIFLLHRENGLLESLLVVEFMMGFEVVVDQLSMSPLISPNFLLNYIKIESSFLFLSISIAMYHFEG